MLSSEISSENSSLRSYYSRIPNFHNQIRKWVRRRFGRQLSMMEPDHLLSIQVDSYRQFLQQDVSKDQRKDVGLHAVFKSIFPIVGPANSNAVLEYVDYHLGDAVDGVEECRARGLTYSAPLRARLRLIVYENTDPDAPPSDEEALESVSSYEESVTEGLTDSKEDQKNVSFDGKTVEEIFSKKKISHIKEQEVYIADIPLMTEGGFIINGTDRIVVSQLHRAPGVLFEQDKTKKHASGKALYTARIIPYRGSWLDFEFDVKNNLFVKIDKHRKLPVTLLLRAFNYSDQEMLNIFFEHDLFEIQDKKIQLSLFPNRLWGEIASFDILDNDGNLIVSQGQRIVARHIQQLKEANIEKLEVPLDYLIGKTLAEPLIDESTGEIIGEVNQELTQALLDHCLELGLSKIKTIYTNEYSSGNYISTTLRLDPTRTVQEALTEVYRCMRPGEFPSQEAAENLFNGLFSSLDRYDLSAIGRMKLNYRLGRESQEGSRLLSREDIIDVLKTLIAIRDGKEKVDNVDHLGNRRVRSVGEMVENQIRLGLVRLERNIKDSLSKIEAADSMPQTLVNAKTINAIIKEFFTINPLSQLKDGINPVSPQWRRISSLGKGGVPSERVGAELRDVDATHYSRLCLIETPEGANIGLINALALLAKPDEFGFLMAPYRKVIDGKVTDQIDYLSALTEGQYFIAQANTTLDAEGRLLDAVTPARHQGDSVLTTPDKVSYMDVSPSQIVSVSAALIPFLEHNDANRALMGSNMQRQAVPLLTAERPLVGTGIEHKVAVDYNAVVVAKRAGFIEAVDASRIVIRVDDKVLLDNAEGVDIYNLIKYSRSNQGTSLNQKPLVKVGDKVAKGDLLADGSCTDAGEIALGRNLLVAFMPWQGYNFEDSIILSERIAHQDAFTSIHLEDLQCIARETPFGEEEMTADIPNINPGMLSNLDESGIVRVGAFVKAGDIIVGKVTPKGEVQLTPEEKLLRAIFGEKASDVKDTSLRVPSGMSGKVIDVSVFTREGLEKDARSQDIEALALEKFKKDLDDELKIYEQDIYQRAKNILMGSTVKKGPKKIKANSTVDEATLNGLTNDQWFKIELHDLSKQEALLGCQKRLEEIREANQQKYNRKRDKLMQGDELTPGVLKIVKVRLAVSRRIQPGDKIAGRHGNKGVISTVVPVEDMPYMADGTPVDIILNPLGVPSRMNIGQILETHLGWAAKELGAKISRLLDESSSIGELRQLLESIYSSGQSDKINLSEMSDQEVVNLGHHLRKGVPIATPVFDGITEKEIRDLLSLAGLPSNGQTTLYDGQTGRAFDRPITVGYMYMLKLNHLIDDKMHARSTGSYSLVTQQPLGGKAQFGGQRFGEMEVWALQGYGAAHTLREMLTIKSDDVSGRAATYKSIVDGRLDIKPGIPESFNVLMKEMLALGLNVKLEEKEESYVESPVTASHTDEQQES